MISPDGGDAVPLCVTSSISLSLPPRLPPPFSRHPSVQPCPSTSSQFSQSGAQRLRFTVASRSFARAASVLRLRHLRPAAAAFSSLLSRTPTRARREASCARADSPSTSRLNYRAIGSAITEMTMASQKFAHDDDDDDDEDVALVSWRVKRL
ncbi:hypothetical protein PUN28_006748 [Cardiocondyla obscurior]|uniref:Uncharacterized protein n=1 Tax=Cardiocondyla obscurior TaxID=286306 RepID=A0AAW2G4K1_9HYME